MGLLQYINCKALFNMRDFNRVKPWKLHNPNCVLQTIKEYAEAFIYALVMLFAGWLLIIILTV